MPGDGCGIAARRRGLTALSAVLIVAGVLSAAAASWQIALVAERLRGQARHLAEAVAAEGYALHHWLHDERIGATRVITWPTDGAARELSAAERGWLAIHSATADWRRSSADPLRVLLPRGWEIVHLIGRRGGQLPDGVIVLRPSDDLVARPAWDAALDVVLGVTGGAAGDLAGNALADYDAARDRAFFASRFARLDTRAVLREAHAGHAILPMETDLVMSANDLLNVGALSGTGGRIPEIAGTCPGEPSDTLCATILNVRDGLTAEDKTTLGTLGAGAVTFSRDVTGITRMRVGEAEISGTVTTSALTACADPGADLCGGGDLDLEAATGGPDWTEAAIFGDVIIRDGNRLTGITTTTAATGFFGTIAAAPRLYVDDCFRSVVPFVHGAEC